jgi:hypothetical protein
MGELEGAVRRIPQALPEGRNHVATTSAPPPPSSRWTSRAAVRRPIPRTTSRRRALDAASKDVVAPFRPINFDKLPGVFRAADGRWFAVHSLNIAFLVNRKLVKDVPQRWSDLLKPEYRNAVVYLDPRSTGQGQVAVFAAAYANGGGVDNPKRAPNSSASSSARATCCASKARRRMRNS